MTKHPVESPADLREILYRRVSKFDRIVPLTRPNADLKWRYVSCLQKAIRRGHSQAAMIAADSLLTVDPSYLWQRLKVIALEDVGLGDPLSCSLVFAASRNRRFRHQLGERQCLLALVDGLAQATKSRDLTHLLLLNHVKPPPAKLWTQYVEKQPLPWLMKFLAINGHGAAGLGAQIPMLHQKMPSTTDVIDMPNDPQGDEVIGGMLAATFDQYTSEGKRSLAYFAVACDDARRFFEHNPIERVKSLGIALFYIEGRCLNRKLVWEGQKNICQTSRIKTCLSHGFQTVEQVAELSQIIRDHREQLNDVRRRIVS